MFLSTKEANSLIMAKTYLWTETGMSIKRDMFPTGMK